MLRSSRCLLAAAVLASAACDEAESPDARTDAGTPEPSWQFTRVEHGLGDATLHEVIARSDGSLVAVGAAGRIAINRGGGWRAMETPTQQDLHGIAAFENGELFGLPAAEGGMIAVGDAGTLLYFNPNPDLDPRTNDSRWSLLAGVEVETLPVRLRADPACPDYDGDGIADDGDGDGWWGVNTCEGGSRDSCDDNCRSSANGDLRPVRDLDADGCLGPEDGPDPSAQPVQIDSDGDGIGDACAAEDAALQRQFRATLFDVWAEADGESVRVVAVGTEGAQLSFAGRSSAAPDLNGIERTVNDAAAWNAQAQLPFRYADDCDADTAPGTVCDGAGRVPPTCPAQCHPRRERCDCPSDGNGCCDAEAPTGVGCVDESCPPAPNACRPDGACSTLCPGCFRRLDTTLRTLAAQGEALVTFGAEAGTLTARRGAPLGVWRFPSCLVLPSPLDERPLITAATSDGQSLWFVGARGLTGRFAPRAEDLPEAPVPTQSPSPVPSPTPEPTPSGTPAPEVTPAAQCPFSVVPDAPPAFLTAVHVDRDGRVWAVGDGGTVLRLDTESSQGLPSVTRVPSGISAGLRGITSRVTPTFDDAGAGEIFELWLVGAGGGIWRGVFE